jgi:hypothetical protein
MGTKVSSSGLLHELSQTIYTPLILDSGEQAHLGNKTQFSFELSWLRHDGFVEIVIR